VVGMPKWEKVPGHCQDLKTAEEVKGNEENKFFIKNLTLETTEQDLANYFSKFGKVASTIMMRDPKMKISKGYALVVFEEGQSIKEEIEFLPHIINGREAKARIYYQHKHTEGVQEETSVEKLFKFSEESHAEYTTTKDLVYPSTSIPAHFNIAGPTRERRTRIKRARPTLWLTEGETELENTLVMNSRIAAL